MLKVLTVSCALVGAAFSLPTADAVTTATTSPNAQEFVVDGGHSSVLFRVMHLSASPFWGRFNQVTGKFMIDASKLDESYVEIEIPTESIDSNSEGRDRHLKSQDFFSAKEFPKLTFKSTKVEAGDDGMFEITGDLTLRGKSKSITIKAENTGTATVSERFGLRTGFESTFEIDRTDFGVSYGTGGVLGEKVRIVIALEGKLPD